MSAGAPAPMVSPSDNSSHPNSTSDSAMRETAGGGYSPSKGQVITVEIYPRTFLPARLAAAMTTAARRKLSSVSQFKLRRLNASEAAVRTATSETVAQLPSAMRAHSAPKRRIAHFQLRAREHDFGMIRHLRHARRRNAGGDFNAPQSGMRKTRNQFNLVADSRNLMLILQSVARDTSTISIASLILCHRRFFKFGEFISFAHDVAGLDIDKSDNPRARCAHGHFHFHRF